MPLKYIVKKMIAWSTVKTTQVSIKAFYRGNHASYQIYVLLSSELFFSKSTHSGMRFPFKLEE